MEKPHPSWMTWVLGIAGFHSVTLGLAALLRPVWLGGLAGLTPEQSLLIAPVGVLLASFGLGYLLAMSNPFRHWPLVLVGFAGKLGLFVTVTAVWLRGGVREQALFLSMADELVWLGPLGIILAGSYSLAMNRRRMASPEILRMALRRKTNFGVTLEELSQMSPVLLVFLRHAGCTFCREALADLAAKRAAIEASGTRLVLVHMGSEAQGARLLGRYGLGEVAHIGDPQRSLYRAFGLPRGTLGDLLGPKVWVRGFQAAILNRHGVGRLEGDGFQMPGVFLLFHGEVLRSYRHQSAADRPDYLALVNGPSRAQPEFQS
jgi:peroxiredoxin